MNINKKTISDVIFIVDVLQVNLTAKPISVLFKCFWTILKEIKLEQFIAFLGVRIHSK